VASQDPIELCPQTLDRAATLVVEKMRPKLNSDAVQCFEGVAQQKELAPGVEWPAVNARQYPRGTDLNTLAGGIDVHVGRHSDG